MSFQQPNICLVTQPASPLFHNGIKCSRLSCLSFEKRSIEPLSYALFILAVVFPDSTKNDTTKNSHNKNTEKQSKECVGERHAKAALNG